MHADDRFDEHAGREVLPGPFLAFAGAFSSNPSKAAALTSTSSAGPLGLVDEADELLEVDRIGEARLEPGVDVAENAGLFAERA